MARSSFSKGAADSLRGTKNLRKYKAVVDQLLRDGKNAEAVSCAKVIFEEWKHLPDGVRAMQLARVKMQAGQLPEAISVLQSVELMPKQQMFLSELLLKANRTPESAAALPADPDAKDWPEVDLLVFNLRRASILLRTGAADDAATLLRDIAAGATRSLLPKHLLWLGRLAREADLAEVTCRAARQVIQYEDLNLEQLQMALDLLLSPLCKKPASQIERDIIEVIPAHLEALGRPAPLLIRFAELLIRAGQVDRASSMLAIPEPGQITNPDAVRLLRLQLQVGAVRLLIETARKIMDEGLENLEQEARVVEFIAKGLIIEGRSDDASELLHNTISKRRDERLVRILGTLLRSMGRHTELSKFSTEQNDICRTRLPESLAQGLTEIPQVPGPTLASAPVPILVPWRLSGLSAAAWPDWSRRLRWGQAASALIRQWGLYAGLKRRSELFDLLEPIDTTPLDEAMALGRGAILVGTHAGPAAACFFAFEKLRWPFAYLGLGGTTAQTGAPGILLTETGSRRSVTAVMNHLARNGIVGVAMDTYSAGGVRTMSIMGEDLVMSRVVPRLSRARVTPSVWYQAEWHNDRIRISLSRLPVPEKQEDRVVWEGRWFTAYEERLLAYLRGEPENLLGLQGWDRGDAFKWSAGLVA